MKSIEGKLEKVWLTEALSPPHGASPTAKNREAQGINSQGATSAPAGGSDQGRLPEGGIHTFMLSPGEIWYKGRLDKLKSSDLEAQVGVGCHILEHKNPQ